jgi:hypothetical protein
VSAVRAVRAHLNPTPRTPNPKPRAPVMRRCMCSESNSRSHMRVRASRKLPDLLISLSPSFPPSLPPSLARSVPCGAHPALLSLPLPCPPLSLSLSADGTDVRSALQSNGELTLVEREAVLQCLQQLSLQELSLQEPESIHRQQGQQAGKGGQNVGGLSSSGDSGGEGGVVDFVKRSSPIEDQKRREGPDGSKDGGKATVPDMLGGSSPRG